MDTRSAPCIRLARTNDLVHLEDIERRAARRFAAVGYTGLEASTLAAEVLAAGCSEERLWVAVDEHDAPIGFALANNEGSEAHLVEMSVLPSSGRRGNGRALVGAVECWAYRQACRAVTLTTFQDVPWNAPFYARMGFVVVEHDDLSPTMRAHLKAEHVAGFPPGSRVAMKKKLG